jgi:hypothetical protein
MHDRSKYLLFLRYVDKSQKTAFGTGFVNAGYELHSFNIVCGFICYWRSQTPHLTHEVMLHLVKLDVWCAVSARRIVVPVFLLRNN